MSVSVNTPKHPGPGVPYVGIDVSKHHLDVAVLSPGKHGEELHERRYRYTARSLRRLAEQLGEVAPGRVMIEASGGLEWELSDHLAAAGLPVMVINPRQVRDYARATGELSKDDKVDAEMLARFAKSVELPLREPPSPRQRELQVMLQRYRQLRDNRVQELNRLDRVHATQTASIERHVAWLDEEIAALLAAIDQRIASDLELAARRKLLRTVPGVGPMVSRVLVVDLPELGRLSRAEIGKLVGVAPLNWDSGLQRGQRHIRGGRKEVRNTLYMAVLSGLTWNPVIAAHFEQLTARGKPGKVAMTACMRKLLGILNSMLKDGRPWIPDFARQNA
jgi:transposase